MLTAKRVKFPDTQHTLWHINQCQDSFLPCNSGGKGIKLLGTQWRRCDLHLARAEKSLCFQQSFENKCWSLKTKSQQHSREFASLATSWVFEPSKAFLLPEHCGFSIVSVWSRDLEIQSSSKIIISMKIQLEVKCCLCSKFLLVWFCYLKDQASFWLNIDLTDI